MADVSADGGVGDSPPSPSSAAESAPARSTRTQREQTPAITGRVTDKVRSVLADVPPDQRERVLQSAFDELTTAATERSRVSKAAEKMGNVASAAAIVHMHVGSTTISSLTMRVVNAKSPTLLDYLCLLTVVAIFAMQIGLIFAFLYVFYLLAIAAGAGASTAATYLGAAQQAARRRRRRPRQRPRLCPRLRQRRCFLGPGAGHATPPCRWAWPHQRRTCGTCSVPCPVCLGGRGRRSRLPRNYCRTTGAAHGRTVKSSIW